MFLKKAILLIIILVFLIGYWWTEEWAFDDLFEDIEVPEEDTQTPEETHHQDTTSYDQNEDQSHGIEDIPSPEYNVYQHQWESYLNIDWDIDFNKHNPLIMLNRDGWTYHSQQVWEDIHLAYPGDYLIRAQIEQNWEYITVDETKVTNTEWWTDNLWDPDAWPFMYYVLFIAVLVSFLIYFKYLRV